MTITKDHESPLAEMLQMIDEAVMKQTTAGCCKAVKRALEEIVASRRDFIAAPFLQAVPDRYARRLIYRDPEGRYTVLAMVWGPGQGTALHDHAGMWCVECVYRGRIRVKSYSLEDEIDGKLRFSQETEVAASVGEAGALIPPFDYHSIENADSGGNAVTLHVYGGDMEWCNAFVPDGDMFRLERRQLTYTA